MSDKRKEKIRTGFLGIDIGSSYTKYAVIDEKEQILLMKVTKTLTRNKEDSEKIISEIYKNYNITRTCSTGYGRKLFSKADLVKTEIYCAAASLSHTKDQLKTIIDIGGEDLKIIKSDNTGKVIDFYMNTKCAAGTGTFINEVAERAEIDLKQMSDLAAKSSFKKELNSFCTVFAKTEIMSWIFNEVPLKDVAKGIYLSIVNRIAKIPIDTSLPIYLIGGVIAHHPYLKNCMEDVFESQIIVAENPQYRVAYGAALLAHLNSKTIV